LDLAPALETDLDPAILDAGALAADDFAAGVVRRTGVRFVLAGAAFLVATAFFGAGAGCPVAELASPNTVSHPAVHAAIERKLGIVL
jgi:hypothetical protein